MELAMVGLGRMGANIVRRLLRDGHRCVVYDVDPKAVAELVAEGAVGVRGYADLVAAMEGPRHVWVMVPAGPITERVIAELAVALEPGDTIIDGGNSDYRDDLRHAHALGQQGLSFVDCGTSGGLFGVDRGYCLMIGGPDEVVARLTPIWDTLAPGVQTATRTPGRSGEPTPEEHGWLHCGPTGSGHFVKMVHNGIEYALMAAYAEGLNILKHANAGSAPRAVDAETAPLANAEHYRYDLPVDKVAEVWRRGSVIGSWLLDLTAQALAASPDLEGFAGHVSDSGEGRWTLQAAIETSTPAPVLAAALFDRFSSRGEDLFAHRVLSAMRKEFGGHLEKPTG